MSKPLVLQLEDRKKEITEAAMSLPVGSNLQFERLIGEHAGVQFVIDLIQSLEKEDD